jgi:predicted PurR-regulated permease PerM
MSEISVPTPGDRTPLTSAPESIAPVPLAKKTAEANPDQPTNPPEIALQPKPGTQLCPATERNQPSSQLSFMPQNPCVGLFFGLGAIILLAILLIELKAIFLPMVMAFFISCLLNPLVNFFTRRRLPHSAAVIMSLVVGFALIWLIFNYIIVSLTAFAAGFPKYSTHINILLTYVDTFINKYINFVSLDMVKSQISNVSIASLVSHLLNYVMSFTGNLMMTILFILYFLPTLPKLPEKLKRSFPGERGEKLCQGVNHFIIQCQNFMLVKTILSMALGLAVTLVCYFFKVDFSTTWGIFAFFLNFIPNLGVPLTVIPPALVCFFQYNLGQTVWFVLVLIIVEMLHGNWIESKFLGRSINLSPTTTLLAVMLWGWLWGLIGTVIALPLMAVVKFICDDTESLKPVGNMMGN